MVGFQPLNHNKQKGKMFPNNNHACGMGSLDTPSTLLPAPSLRRLAPGRSSAAGGWPWRTSPGARRCPTSRTSNSFGHAKARKPTSSSREVRISWFPMFILSVVYFSRGTLAPKSWCTGTGGPGKTSRKGHQEVTFDIWLWLKKVVPEWHLGKWNQRLKPA